MSSSRLLRVYARLPVWLQNVACTLEGLRMRRQRYNRTFRATLAFLEQSQQWSLEELREYQNEQLRRMVGHAYETVPYYREVLDERHLRPADIRTVADLPKLPVLEKQTVRERYDDLLSRGWPARRRVHYQTGGTTGTAMRLVTDIDASPWMWATVWRHRRRFGIDVRDPFIVFAGRDVVPLSDMRPPFWRRNWPMHQTYVSIHHMTKPNMAPLVEYLQKRRVRYYSGYPSALYLLATYMREQGIRLQAGPAIVFTGAETLLAHQRELIGSVLGCEVAEYYGAAEQGAHVSECERHGCHVDMELGIIEFLPVPGGSSRLRRIVSSGFRNPVMPLLRYNMGDLATLSAGKACLCGRAAPMVERIDGRIESYIITPDGRQLGRLDFLFKESQSIREAQLIQDAADHLTVKVVRGAGYAAADEAALQKDLRAYLGEQIRIEIEYPAEIPRDANGKFRQIVSKVFQDRYGSVSDATVAGAADGLTSGDER